MSSEALERAEKLERIRYDLTLPCQSQFIRNDAEWLLAEVARLEQERDAEAELFNEAQAALAVAREREQCAEQQRATYAKAWVDQQYRLQTSTAALADLLDTMERGDEYKAFERMTAARAALVDEPAAAAAADEPHLGPVAQAQTEWLYGVRRAAADEPTRVIEGIVYDPSLDSGRTAVVTADEHVYIEAELPAEGERVRVVITELRRAADEPGETP